MSPKLKWWHAQVNLAWRVVVHYLKKLWPLRKRYGYERFVNNYVAEGFPSYSSSFRAIAHKPSRCTTCGMCEIVCPILKTKEHPDFIGPMRMVVSGMRGGPTLFDVESSLKVLASPDCILCNACERACPEQIPILSLAQGFLDQIHEVRLLKSPRGATATEGTTPT